MASWDARTGGGTATRSQQSQETAILDYADSVAGGSPSSSDSVRYISGNGNDANNGLTQRGAKRSLSAAYTSLPSTGGTIYALPGDYDLGSGFNGSQQKLIDLIGLVKPTKVIGSGSTTPLSTLSTQAAVFRASGNPVDMITFTAGTAVATYFGVKFQNLVFQLSGSNMLRALHLPNACRSEVSNCLFFADKTTSPTPSNTLGVLFRSDGTANADSSWNRVFDNEAINCGVVRFGNLTATGITNSNNQNWAFNNVGEGLAHTDTTTEAAVTFVGGHRCGTWGNNFEAYYRGLLADRCWQCSFSGDGGEVCDFFYDLVSTHTCWIAPLGPSFKNLGSSTPKSWVTAGATFLVRGDASTKRNIIIILNEDASATNGGWDPTDDATYPAISLASADNVVISPRWSKDFQRPGGTSTSTPGAVTTVNIPHGLGTTPVQYLAQPANANARGAPAFYLSADATNVTLNFASALAAATSYSWTWKAEAR